MIEYINSLKDITEDNIRGFFIGWTNPPSTKKHIKLLENSSYFWLAKDSSTENIIGFINAISDRTLCAYIPLLEVLPRYQGKGIGSELVKHMMQTLKDYYMVDIICDENLVSFYKRFGLYKSCGMMMRNFKMQGGI